MAIDIVSLKFIDKHGTQKYVGFLRREYYRHDNLQIWIVPDCLPDSNLDHEYKRVHTNGE